MSVGRDGGSGGDARPTARDALLLAPVAGATVALLWIVPELPVAHLDDPGHWGVIGYLVVAAGLVSRTLRGTDRESGRRLLALFLAGMPVVYVAFWARFGGSVGWLGVEVGGAALYGGLAWMGVSRSAWLLPLGICGHALWDLGHYGATSFVHDWYVIACVVVDVAVGAHAAAWMGIEGSSRYSRCGRRHGARPR